MKYPEIVADKLTLQAGHGSIAVPLLRMVGVGSLTLIAKVAATLCVLANC